MAMPNPKSHAFISFRSFPKRLLPVRPFASMDMETKLSVTWKSLVWHLWLWRTWNLRARKIARSSKQLMCSLWDHLVLKIGSHFHHPACIDCRVTAFGLRIWPVVIRMSDPVWFTFVRRNWLSCWTEYGTPKSRSPYWSCFPKGALKAIGAQYPGAKPILSTSCWYWSVGRKSRAMQYAGMIKENMLKLSPNKDNISSWYFSTLFLMVDTLMQREVCPAPYPNRISFSPGLQSRQWSPVQKIKRSW